MKAAAYLRVSSSEQDYLNQLAPVKDYCCAHCWPEPEIYAESESGWRAGHQAELARLLNEVRSGKRKYDRLVIWSLDRLSRGGIGELFGLIHTFRQYGCQVVSCQEPWLESAGPAGDLLLAVTAWIAQFESQRRSERTKAGQARARANGSPIGKRGKDKNPRRRAGYLARYMQKGVRQTVGVGRRNGIT